MKFKDFTINFLLAGLFLVAMLSFAVGIANNYGYDESFITTDMINFTETQEQVESINEQALGWERLFTSDNLFVALGGIILFSLWGIMTLVWSAGFGLFNIFLQGVYNVIGIPPMVTGVITAIAIITLIFAAWRLIKQGE